MEELDFNNPVWRDLVLDKIQVNLNFLAAKILLTRWQVHLQNNASLAEVEKAKREVFDLYYRSKDFPSAQKDILLLLNK